MWSVLKLKFLIKNLCERINYACSRFTVVKHVLASGIWKTKYLLETPVIFILKVYVDTRRKIYTQTLALKGTCYLLRSPQTINTHYDVIKWKHFPRYWPFVRIIHRSPMNSLHRGQWRGALIFSLICAWINGWVNNRGAGDLRRRHVHYYVTVMFW